MAARSNGGRSGGEKRGGEKRGSGRRPDGFVQKGNARYDRHDAYYRQAKKEGFAARSVYKLEELDRELDVVKPTDRVLDLGCAPGSWLQYVERKVRARGSVVGIDLLPVGLSFGPHVRILQGDAFKTPAEELMRTTDGRVAPFDLVLSDMAPNTTGIKSVDQARSLALCERALDVARAVLVPGGRFAVKIFEGGEMQSFLAACKETFESVKVKRPKGTRAGSKETYVVCHGRRPERPEP